MLRVFARTASVALAVWGFLGLAACEDKPPEEVPPQFRPSMATIGVSARPVERLPPRVVRRPLDLERYKAAKAPVVELRPGKSICRECEMRKTELLRRAKAKAKHSRRPKIKQPLASPNLPEENSEDR